MQLAWKKELYRIVVISGRLCHQAKRINSKKGGSCTSCLINIYFRY